MNLKTARASKNLTQKDFANKLGVNQSLISHFEQGRRTPNYTILEKMALVLDVDIIVLVRYFQKKENKNNGENENDYNSSN